MHRMIKTIVVLALIAAPIAADETHGRTYDIQILDSDVAEAIIVDICNSSESVCMSYWKINCAIPMLSPELTWNEELSP